MENIEKIISKKEKDIIHPKVFFEEHPEFLEDVGNVVTHDGNNIRYENRELSLSLNFEEIFLSQFSTEDFPELYKVFLDKKIDLNDYFRLTEFTIKSGNSEYSLDDEKEKPVIIFKKNPESKIMGGLMHLRSKLIIINSLPSNPKDILMLMHELGHTNDEGLLTGAIRIEDILKDSKKAGRITGEMKKEEDALILGRERFAWAYALNKLKPFIKSLNVTDVGIKKYVHNSSLGSYCKIMSKNYED